MYKIKSFGKDSIAISAREVIDTLNARYQGQSVAIHIKNPSAMTHVFFVDVAPDGTVTDSYTKLPITVEFLLSNEALNNKDSYQPLKMCQDKEVSQH